MAAFRNCNPAPDPWNEVQLSAGEGEVLATFRWTWDGVSVWPACAGPLIGARITNTGTRTWYAHLVGKRGQPRSVPIPPGTDATRDAAWLAQRGLDSLSDLDDFTITATP